MEKSAGTITARALAVQMLAHALIFAGQNAGTFAERALLAADTAATAVLGLSWTAVCLLSAFTINMVNVGQLVVARYTGDGDESGARAATGQAMLLAGGGGVLGLALAVVAGAVAVLAVGPTRDAAIFMATQGLALGPLLGARACMGYLAGTMRLGPRMLAAVTLAPMIIHLALVWLLAGLLSWSVAGVGLARIGAALAAVVAAFMVARAELRGLAIPFRWPDWALLWKMFTEGSVLGLQQVIATLMVLLLYLTAARAGDITSAALTLTHSGVYPLLFCFAWGSSQAISAAAAQAVGRRDARELARVTRLGLGLSAGLAFVVPWGAFTAFGEPTLAWVVAGSPASDAVLAASLRFMVLLAVFFVFDFAINFLSALLKAAKEQAYLLKATAVAAAGFGLVVIALPRRPDDACLMGTFITAQAAWAVLLLIRVCGRWPGTALTPGVATLGRVDTPAMGADGRLLLATPVIMPRISTPEDYAMDPLQPNTALLPPALRALALGLLIETGVSLLNKTSNDNGASSGQSEGELWQALRYKCGELSAMVLRAEDPGEAATYVLGYLPKHFDYVFEQVYGPKRRPVLGALPPVSQLALRNGQHHHGQHNGQPASSIQGPG